MQITDKSLEVFLAYAEDAGNWSGTPLIGGNVGGSTINCRKRVCLYTRSVGH